ncbi:hypothetical protein P12x_001138 [Tundrisphaera lichenicola]|uniref:hypothetical protein n=1 Tax=Tundrisphaera lichenicola TaxID=2029860 RepID=UPI003EC001AB
MAMFLRMYRFGTTWPPSADVIRLVAEAYSIPRDQAEMRIAANEQLRAAIEEYIGQEIGDEPSIRKLFHRLSVDFGLSTIEVDRLHPMLLNVLLTNFQRWRQATGEEKQDVLHHVAKFADKRDWDQFDSNSVDAFLKALKRFPQPAPERNGLAEGEGEGEASPTRATIDDSELSKPGAPPPAELAELLRKQRPKAVIQIRFLEFMAEREWALVIDIAHDVHGDKETSDQAVRANVSKINRFLEGEGFDTRFRVGGGRVYREKSQA